MHDAQLYDERYNLLNAFLAAVPGNHAFNLRYLYLLNTNYADFPFSSRCIRGEPRNAHLRQEYLAVLETSHGTPYFLNLHYRDVAHSMILGRTGVGKSFPFEFPHYQSAEIRSVHLHFRSRRKFRKPDAAFRRLLSAASGVESADFTINPFCSSSDQSRISIFWRCFVKVLLGHGNFGTLDPATDRELYEQIENLYSLDPALRTLDVLANTLPRPLTDALAKWMRGGQFGFLFDNPEDTISFSRFQCFDFQQMSRYPELLEPLLFYILHRANEVIANRDISSDLQSILHR